MRSVVYAGTRNVYGDIETALKSLLYHTRVDRVYILAEDDALPFIIPGVKVINASGQTYFSDDSPNFKSPWTYMVLLRAAYGKLFPDEEVVLSLDIDTIVTGDISELWEIPMGGVYLAGAREPHKAGFPQPYLNFGVLLMNLKELRPIEDAMIRELNTRYTFANEQDVMNSFCRKRVRVLPSCFNACAYTEPCDSPKIVHFAGVGEHLPWSGKRWQDDPLVQKYRGMKWEDIL